MRIPITLSSLIVALALCFVPAFARAERMTSDMTVGGSLSSKPIGNQIEMFSGIKSGEIEVTLIPKDTTEATVLFRNKTGKPVAIKVPEAFAGVPVLAQGPGALGGPPGGRGRGGAPGMGGGGMMGGMQGVGGGMMGGGMMGGGMMGGMMGGGMMGGGMMGGMMGAGIMNIGPDKVGKVMNVAPDKIVKMKVPLVCLEHGKKDPNPRVKYEIVPIESFTDNAEVAELCKMLGHGEINQNAAQAAAWHLASGVTWEQLAVKERSHYSTGEVEMYFEPGEIVLASKIATVAEQRAKFQKEQSTAAAGKLKSQSQK